MTEKGVNNKKGCIMNLKNDTQNFLRLLTDTLEKKFKNLFKTEKNEKNSTITLQFSDDNSPYQQEITQLQSAIQTAREYQDIKNNIMQGASDEQQQNAQKLVNTFQDAQPLVEVLSADAKELETIFTSALSKMADGTQNFSDIMKNVLNDLKNYFIKSISDAIVNGIINSTVKDSVSSLFSGFGESAFSSNSTKGIFSNILHSIFSFHSGGLIPQGTGFSLPGTSEYLTVLKGGERVLSPSENTAYNNESQNNGNVVVNNFNIKSWDSKDVQQYLLDNKNLLANITADNIKYNNANLRYMIGRG